MCARPSPADRMLLHPTDLIRRRQPRTRSQGVPLRRTLLHVCTHLFFPTVRRVRFIYRENQSFYANPSTNSFQSNVNPEPLTKWRVFEEWNLVVIVVMQQFHHDSDFWEWDERTKKQGEHEITRNMQIIVMLRPSNPWPHHSSEAPKGH